MASKRKPIVRYRSADDGRFVTERFAKKHPKITIKDTMKRQPPKKKT